MDLTAFPLFLSVLISFQPSVESVKCFTCYFTINRCTDLNCYNSPDNCSPKFFTAAVVPFKECPAGCEMFSISDSNGIVLEWRRGCDTSGNTAGTAIDFTSKCKTEYVFGTRMDKCFCNQDFCNSSAKIKPGLIFCNYYMLK
uniref:Protein sleepless n=1 Tax=Tetranychus urticae TaxID=32264 RepID=T1KIZ0_TETUR